MMIAWIGSLVLLASAQSGTAEVDAFLEGILEGRVDPVMADWSVYATANDTAAENSFRDMMATIMQPVRARGYDVGQPIHLGEMPCLALGVNAGRSLLEQESEVPYSSRHAEATAWFDAIESRLAHAQADVVTGMDEADPRREMLQRGVADQWWRRIYFTEARSYAQQHPDLREFIEYAFYYRLCVSDRSNTEYLRDYIEANGWPDDNLMGREFGQYTWLILQHADLETQEHILPILQEAADQDQARPRNLATLIDRVRLRNNEQQIYGTQWECRNGEFAPHDLIDPETVDARRAEVGLAPLEESFSDMPHPNCPVPD